MAVLPTGIGPVTGYNIERSLRFNSADSAYLNRTPGSASNRKTWTWSGWVKRCANGARQSLFSASSSFNGHILELYNDDTLIFYNTGTATDADLYTSQLFRDPSAWYHIVLAVDTTQATASNRLKLYVNGGQITTFGTANYPTQNSDLEINNTIEHNIGRRPDNQFYHNGYLTEVNLIDGQALTPSSFGETDAATGVWKPKAYSGTYGTNGFFLKFADNSGTTSTTLGKDSSGNGNNWTPNNFSVTAGAGNDSMVDSPTAYGTDTGVGGSVRGNYATFNPLFGTATLANGNLQLTGPVGDALRASTLGVTSGKWYTEITVASALSGSATMGVAIYNQAALPTVNGTSSRGYFYTGQKYSNGTLANYGTSFTNNGDVIGVAIDLDNGKVWFSKNGTWQASGDPAAGTNAAYTDLGTTSTWFVTVQTGGATGGATCHANFGQRAFAYTAPSGFKALCTTNLPTPTIGATSTTQADNYFNTVLYTGNGSTQSITGVGFQPDFTWLKVRSTVNENVLSDAVRGAGYRFYSNLTAAEVFRANGLNAFNADGFSLGDNSDSNASGQTFVAWNWKANGAGSSNTSGTITSTVSANTTSGFSIATYTGNGSGGATVGHGLGVSPAMIFIKSRSNSTNWMVWHQNLTANYAFEGLNTTGAEANGGSPSKYVRSVSSTLVTIGDDISVNQSASYTYVMYCFAPVAGYSAFGKYTGNGASDGPFLYTGFRPRYVLIKRSDSTGSWYVMDTARDTYNAANLHLYPNLSNAEGVSGHNTDILSNGFKARGSAADLNASGGTYIYMALAESPFKFSLAR